MEASTALTPRLEQAGIQVVENDGARMIEIPDALRRTHNVLVPVSEIVQANPLWQPAIRAVRLDPKRHSYPGQKKGELALNKHAVLLLARTAGIDVLGTSRMPIAVLRENEMGWQATVRVRRADGTHEEMTESRVMDLTIEREAIDFQVNTASWNANKSEAQLAQERQKRWLNERPHFDAKCETKALLRAVRAVLQLPHAFSDEDFAKPFLVLTYAFSPDTNDPEVMRALIAAGVNGAASMYGRPRAVDVDSQDLPALGHADGEVPLAIETAAVSEKAPGAADDKPAGTGEPVTTAPRTTPVASETADRSPGAHVISVGKYAGREILDVYAEDPGYVTNTLCRTTRLAGTPDQAAARAFAKSLEDEI